MASTDDSVTMVTSDPVAIETSSENGVALVSSDTVAIETNTTNASPVLKDLNVVNGEVGFSDELKQHEDKSYSLLNEFYHVFSEKKYDLLLELVSDRGVDINHMFVEDFVAPTDKDWAAIHLVAKGGKVKILKEIVDLGADVLLQNKKGDTALHIACKHAHFECVEFLLSCDESLKDMRNFQGLTPLFKTIFRYETVFKKTFYKKTMKRLLKAKCDVNLCSSLGVSPLHMAASKWDPFLVQALVNAGANVNSMDKKGLSPLMTAVTRSVINSEIVSILVKAGADVTTKNPSGKTPLHIAVSKSNDSSVLCLLQAGADPNMADKDGNTPLWIAVNENDVKIVPLLLQCGGDVNHCKMLQHLSLLSLAVMNQSVKMVELLISNGALVDMETVLSSTPLHFAVQGQNESIVKLLLRENCKLDVYSNAKNTLIPQTPFQQALETGNLQVIKLLIQCGCMVSYRWLLPNRLPRALRDNYEVYEWIWEYIHTPPKLSHLCCISLRQELGIDLKTTLKRMIRDHSIPKRISDVILLTDILS